jgi:hypothetical protein
MNENHTYLNEYRAPLARHFFIYVFSKLLLGSCCQMSMNTNLFLDSVENKEVYYRMKKKNILLGSPS